MKVTNNSNTPLGIPGMPILMPGTSADCKNWNTVKKNKIVQSWLKSRSLVAGDAKPEPEPEGNEKYASLLGSDVLPADVELAEGVTVPLGDVVTRAFEASGLTRADWNELADDAREELLQTTLEEMQAEQAGDNDDEEGESEKAEEEDDLLGEKAEATPRRRRRAK